MQRSNKIDLRDAGPADHQFLLDVNQANLPEVGPLDDSSLTELMGMQQAVRIAMVANKAAGAVFLMRPGQPYASTNYQWFCENSSDFLYVDRIMITADFRGMGLGRALYQDAEILARACGAARITCEINTLPPNPGSFAFHDKLGFSAIHERDSGSGKRVMMMEKRLA